MVGDDDEWSALKIRAPFVHRHHDSEELLLVDGEALIPHPQRLAEIGNGVAILHEHRAHTRVARVRLDREWAREVRQGQHGRVHHGVFEELERGLSLCGPGESLLGEQLGQGLGENSIARHELPVIAGEAKKPAQLCGICWCRPCAHRACLAVIRRHALP